MDNARTSSRRAFVLCEHLQDKSCDDYRTVLDTSTMFIRSCASDDTASQQLQLDEQHADSH